MKKIFIDTEKFDNEMEKEIRKVENFKIAKNAIGTVALMGSASVYGVAYDKLANSEDIDDKKKTIGCAAALIGVGLATFLASTCVLNAIEIYEDRKKRNSKYNIKKIQIQKDLYIQNCIEEKMEEIKKAKAAAELEAIEELPNKKKKR